MLLRCRCFPAQVNIAPFAGASGARCVVRGASGLGFTLLELLLVIVVLGIIAGLVMPALLGDEASRVLRRSVDQALAVMTLQEEEAVLTGVYKGLLIARHSEDSNGHQSDAGEVVFYRWFDWAADEERWVVADVPRRFNGTFDAVGDIQLTIDGKEVTIPDDAPERRPQIVIFSSGEVTEFELRLAAGGNDDTLVEWTLVGGYDGIRLADEDED